MRRIRVLKTAAFPRRRASPLSSALCHVLQVGPHIRRHRSYYFGSIQRSILVVYNTYPQAPQLLLWKYTMQYISSIQYISSGTAASSQFHFHSQTQPATAPAPVSNAPGSRKIAKKNTTLTQKETTETKKKFRNCNHLRLLCYVTPISCNMLQNRCTCICAKKNKCTQSSYNIKMPQN